MSTIVELKGGVAVLRDDAELSNREVKHLRRAAKTATGIALKLRELGYSEESPETFEVISLLPDEEYENLDLFQRTCVIVRLESWTLDRPMPLTVEDVDDLPREVFNVLTTAAANIKLSDDFSMEGASDPKAGIENSDN